MSSKPVQIPKKSTLVYTISLLMLMMCKQQKGANVLQPPVKGLTPTALARLPVNDSMPVQEHQRRRDLSRVKARSRLVELPRALNLKHQVASINVLHHEEQPVLERERERESHTHLVKADVQNCTSLLKTAEQPFPLLNP